MVNNRAHRNREFNGCAIPAGSITALAMPSPFGRVFRVIAEVQQGIVVLAGNQNYIAASAAIASARSAARDKLFPSKRETPVPAIARFDRYQYFVYEHSECLWRRLWRKGVGNPSSARR